MSEPIKPSRLAGYALLFVFLFLALEYAWLRRPHEEGRGGGRPRIGSSRSGCPADSAQRKDYGVANYSWSLKSLDGEEISFSQFRGKTVFLNVWATWCGPCVDEMPDIQALYESLKNEAVAFVLLSEEEMGPVKEFVAEQGLDAPIYIATSSLPDVFESRGIPATFIVDPEGHIVLRRIGAAHWDSDECRSFLRSLGE